MSPETSTRIRAAIEQAKQEKRAAFIPYITAGDPSLQESGELVLALAKAGADVIELGVPFSDPVADGPTNQAAAQRALERGASLEKVLALVKSLRSHGLTTPLVLFTYLNPVFRLGYEGFAAQAKAAGADGALIVDLPPEEAQASGYGKAMQESGLATIFLASPTTAPARIQLIDESSTGFIYYVSRTGVTGVRHELSTTLETELRDLRKKVTRNPIAVGFGISTPEHARAIAPHADAVVMGSALVKIIETGPTLASSRERIEALTAEILKELKKSC